MPRRKNRSRSLLKSDDGWSIIPGRNHAPVRLALEDQLEQPSIAPSGDFSHLSRDLENASNVLLTYPVLAPLRRAARLLKPGVKRVLVLGLGSLEGATRSSSMLQLAMVQEVVALLGGKVEVVFWDPAFTGTDIAFLRERWKVERVGDAQDRGENTVLLAPHLDFDVLAKHLEDTQPPVLVVSNDLRHFMDLRIGDTKAWSAFQRYLGDEEYHEKPFLVEDKGGWGIGRAFNDLAVYWRRDAVRKDGNKVDGEPCEYVHE